MFEIISVSTLSRFYWHKKVPFTMHVRYTIVSISFAEIYVIAFCNANKLRKRLNFYSWNTVNKADTVLMWPCPKEKKIINVESNTTDKSLYSSSGKIWCFSQIEIINISRHVGALKSLLFFMSRYELKLPVFVDAMKI